MKEIIVRYNQKENLYEALDKLTYKLLFCKKDYDEFMAQLETWIVPSKRCVVCDKETDGSLIFVEPLVEPSHLIMCKECFNLACNQEYDKLSEIINKRFKEND